MKKEKNTETDMKKGPKSFFLLAGILCLMASGFLTFFIYEKNSIYKECYAEAGVEVSPQDFLKKEDPEARFAYESDRIDTAQPGKYQIVIKKGIFTHKSTLYIEDTIAPSGNAVEINLEWGKECGPEAFVFDITDATEVTVKYVQKPDFTKVGRQNVEIVMTDLGGNQTRLLSELYISPLVEEVVVEAGSMPPTLQDFLIGGKSAKFISNMRTLDYTTPSQQKILIEVDGAEYETTMRIVDTIPPVVEMKDVQSYTLVPRKAEDFVASVEDITEVTMEFTITPNLNLQGEQTVEVCVTDAGGNAVVKTAKLTLEADTEAPVISGAADISVVAGSSVSYKKQVRVTDNCQEGLELDVDSSAVNLKAEGIYPVTYTARDAAGNETSATVNVIVKPRVYSESEVYALADKVLARIIKPEMTPLEKVRAIYDYNMSHITYISHSEKGDWLRAAFEGFVDGKGDCYVYACTAKALLTRAGIPNIDIIKIPSKSSHFWNLVDLGEGWYHFDTTPRKDHPTIFMWTDAQLMEYSQAHDGSHNYDPTLYPAIN